MQCILECIDVPLGPFGRLKITLYSSWLISTNVKQCPYFSAIFDLFDKMLGKFKTFVVERAMNKNNLSRKLILAKLFAQTNLRK